jgi:RNA methyltransferase, TrmH family
MITSKDNPKIKHIKKLLSNSKYRKEQNAYVLENQNFIEDTLNQSPHLILEIIHANNPESIKDRLHSNTELTEVSDEVFKTLPNVKTSFGALAICKIEQSERPKTPSTIIYLDTINKPNNLGAILRNAAAFNCNLVALSPNSTDPYHPESIRASAGHIQKTPIVTSTLDELIKTYPNHNIYTLDSNATKGIEDIPIKKPALFIFGSEKGISDDIKKHIQSGTTCKISIQQNVDSLNVAATTAIILYECNKK